MENQVTKEMSAKEWFITLLISHIPLIGLIMLFIWAFGNDLNKTRQNYAKGYLLLGLLGIVLAIIFIAIFGSIFAATMASQQNY